MMKTASGVMREYREGEAKFCAAKITLLERLSVPGIAGCARLTFGAEDAVANVLGWWVNQNSPEVGGWFVVPETGGAMFMRDADFNQRFGQ